MEDHLGSIRQTLSESGAVQSAMDYYAFGGTMSGYVNGNTVDKYKFTGKERDSETGLDYFGARYYDSKIGRWMSMDPLAEKYPGLSPYNYCLNNPFENIDPNGSEVYHYTISVSLNANGLSGSAGLSFVYDNAGNAGIGVSLSGGVSIGYSSNIGTVSVSTSNESSIYDLSYFQGFSGSAFLGFGTGGVGIEAPVSTSTDASINLSAASVGASGNISANFFFLVYSGRLNVDEGLRNIKMALKDGGEMVVIGSELVFKDKANKILKKMKLANLLNKDKTENKKTNNSPKTYGGIQDKTKVHNTTRWPISYDPFSGEQYYGK